MMYIWCRYVCIWKLNSKSFIIIHLQLKGKMFFWNGMECIFFDFSIYMPMLLIYPKRIRVDARCMNPLLMPSILLCRQVVHQFRSISIMASTKNCSTALFVQFSNIASCKREESQIASHEYELCENISVVRARSMVFKCFWLQFVETIENDFCWNISTFILWQL